MHFSSNDYKISLTGEKSKRLMVNAVPSKNLNNFNLYTDQNQKRDWTEAFGAENEG